MNISVASPVIIPGAAGQGSGKASAEGAADFMAMLQSMTSSEQEPGTAAGQKPAETVTDAPRQETPSDQLPSAVSAPALFQTAPQAARPEGSSAAGSVPVPEAELQASAVPERTVTAEQPDPAAQEETVDEHGINPQQPAVPSAEAPQVPAAQAQPQNPAAAAAAASVQPPESKTPAQAAPAVLPAPGTPGPVNVRMPEPVMVQAGVQAAPALTRPAAFRMPEPAQASVPESEAPSAQAAPVQIQAPVTQTAATAAPVPVHAPAPAQQPLHTQLAKPLFTLATAENGEHVMTMKVTPEELGTVTVRAVIGPEGVRMELFASEAGREAVKAIMPDLRRDMAGAGFNASLDLGTGSRPDGQADSGERRTPAGQDSRNAPEPAPREQPSPADQRMFTDGAASLDVLA